MWNDLYSGNIFQVTQNNFEAEALALFRFQAENNTIYREYIRLLGLDPLNVSRLHEIPFLPIEFFKTHRVATTEFTTDLLFESSGTTGTIQSQHWVKDPFIYERSFLEGFRLFYGNVENWCVLGLLPSYLERKHSSLVYMVEDLVKRSGHPSSGFYLYDHEKLKTQLKALEAEGQQTLLIGVTFGLLDFAEEHPMQLKHTVVMETGGMKGRRQEWTRQEVHQMLQAQLGVSSVHSEYGMTELLSQAYSSGEGIFKPVPWLKMFVREEDDPLKIYQEGKGVLNVIDLANVYSCAFIATQDLGHVYPDGRFEVLGRIDHSDVRGCSLMLAM
jgi:phenylacetate-coenzyme A ligase PaaK-like adenylate-forming protein